MFMQLGGNDDEGGLLEQILGLLALESLLSGTRKIDPSTVDPARVARHLEVEKKLFGDETFGDWVDHATIRGCPGCGPMYEALKLHIPEKNHPKRNMQYNTAADQLIAQLNKL